MLTYFFAIKRITPPLSEYAVLEEMLALRKLGYSYQVLADKYKVDKTTIRYLARRFGLAGEVQVLVKRKPIHTTTSTEESSYHKPEKPRTYADYLQADRERKWRELVQRHSAQLQHS